MFYVFAAVIAAIALLVTSGYALGGARRRKAIMELLEIRQGIALVDLTDRVKIDRLIKSELDSLVEMGNTTMRWIRRGFYASIILGAGALVAWLTADAFITSKSARITAVYASAVMLISATLISSVAAMHLWEVRMRPSWLRPFSFLPLLIVAAIGTVATWLILLGTPYHEALLKLHTK